MQGPLFNCLSVLFIFGYAGSLYCTWASSGRSERGLLLSRAQASQSEVASLAAPSTGSRYAGLY